MKFLTHTLVKLLGRAGYTVKKRRPGVRRSVSGEVEAVEPGKLMDAIHGKDIYEGFEFGQFESDLQGWGSNSPAFAELIEEVEPKFIIEVGTWKGGSAVAMANCLREKGIENGVILFGDDWAWSAVERFAGENRIEIRHVHDKWVLARS